MMKKEASKITIIKCITRVLSPFVLITLISLSITTIFSGNNPRVEWLKYSVLRDRGNQQLDKQETSGGDTLATKQRHLETNDWSNQKSITKFIWSSDLQEWTIERDSLELLKSDTTRDTHNWGCIWPEDCDSNNKYSEDRIVNQLRLFDSYDKSKINYEDSAKIFKILPPTGSSYPVGGQLFLQEACPINRCSITYDKGEADALIFQNSDVVNEPPKYRRADQIWIAYLLESPSNTFDKRFERLYRGKHEFNWTASYRSDSDLVTPYSKFVPYKDQVNEVKSLRLISKDTKNSVRESSAYVHKIYASRLSAQQRSLIRGKEGKVAWFASNCNAANNRLEYAKELAKYIQVDIYGRCGNLTCDKWNQTGCFDMINKNYKFYLSFENSNCHQYITEKLFRNAFGYNDLNYLVLPIVMGPSREEYLRYAPPASFIHVDEFASLKELAEYLKLLDSDEALYYSYFHWKSLGQFIDTKFMCRVCALLHETHKSSKHKSYTDIKRWWTTCNETSSSQVDCCT